MSAKQSDFDILMNYNIDIRGRVLYFYDDINSESSSLFIKCLKYLDKTSGNIKIIMNCEGGDVSCGFAMYDAIKSCKNEVYIKVLGNTMSMASVVLQAADKRIMGPSARMMIHVGGMEVAGHFKNVKRAVQENDELDKICMDIYLEKINEVNSDFKKSQLQRMMDFDTYISAQRCLELGLIDEIDED
jgi:ATP-dependent Clp protease protease subunit